MKTEIVAFEREYRIWLEEQNRRVSEIRTALQANLSEIELRELVDSCLNHYTNLSRIKADAAKADVGYLLSGMWRTLTERFSEWIGGFRPSELLHVVLPYLQPLTDQKIVDVRTLQQSCQFAEDSLTQGLDRFKKIFAERIATEITVVQSTNHMTQKMATTLENLQTLLCYVNQADHLRHETLRHMNLILTTRQVAWGLLVLGEYLHRPRALSSL